MSRASISWLRGRLRISVMRSFVMPQGRSRYAVLDMPRGSGMGSDTCVLLAKTHVSLPMPGGRSDDREGVEHRAGRALDLQREREEEELVDLLPGDLLEVHRLEQVDAVLDEQQRVHRLRVGRRAGVGRGLHLV